MSEVKLNCQVCDQPKARLERRNSQLLPTQMLAVCSTCIENEWEPRWLIILVGRQKDIKAVSKYVVRHLYAGEDIKASDLIRE